MLGHTHWPLPYHNILDLSTSRACSSNKFKLFIQHFPPFSPHCFQWFLLQGCYNLGYVEKELIWNFLSVCFWPFYETAQLIGCPIFYRNLKGGKFNGKRRKLWLTTFLLLFPRCFVFINLTGQLNNILDRKVLVFNFFACGYSCTCVSKCHCFVMQGQSMCILPLGLFHTVQRRHCGRKFLKTVWQKEKMLWYCIYIYICKEGSVHRFTLSSFSTQPWLFLALRKTAFENIVGKGDFFFFFFNKC